jgi:hypothetical protein
VYLIEILIGQLIRDNAGHTGLWLQANDNNSLYLWMLWIYFIQHIYVKFSDIL